MKKRRLLIVDDEPDRAGRLEQRLVGLGYEVTAIAASGEDAVTRAARDAPDLALIEMSSGDGSNGIAAAAGELMRRARIPCVWMAADPNAATSALARDSGTDIHVLGPFTERELHATIELAICRHAASMAVDPLEGGFFATSIDLLCLLDFNGHFKRLNPAWEQTLGFTREELMAKPFIEFVHPDDRERTLKQNLDVRRGGKALSFENRYVCKDGSYRWLRWNAASDSAERVIYSMARDVTASKQAGEERERLLHDLQIALAEVKTLREILPICSYCRKIRDDENYWHTVENYISEHTMSRFSHSICPGCMATVVNPQLTEDETE